MIHALTIAITFFIAGCSLRSTYPTLGGIIGGSAGSLGGPGSAALGAGAGVLAGEALKNADKLVEAEEKIEALTHGDVSALVASLGLTGFALGFALRDALSNVLSGVLVLIYRPFKRGDSIKVTGFEGKVIEIDLRYTSLQMNGSRVLIPNSSLFNNPVVIVDVAEEQQEV